MHYTALVLKHILLSELLQGFYIVKHPPKNLTVSLQGIGPALISAAAAPLLSPQVFTSVRTTHPESYIPVARKILLNSHSPADLNASYQI